VLIEKNARGFEKEFYCYQYLKAKETYRIEEAIEK
jgi:hypothetical protein